MRPKIRYINFYDPESVCTGDILKSKEDGKYYVVIWINVEGEEWYCVEVGVEGKFTDLIKYIGFENVDQYGLSEIEEQTY